MEAFQLTTKTSRVGFDWPAAEAALAKLDEETLELREAVRGAADARHVAEEDRRPAVRRRQRRPAREGRPGERAQAANRKFRRRFRFIEERLRGAGKTPAESTLEEMDRLWNEAKSLEP